MTSKVESVAQLALFSGVSPVDCEAIISAGRERRFYRREVLFSAGDPVDHVFLLLSGSVKMTQTGFRGSEVMLRVIGAGDLIGTVVIWSDGKHNCAAQVGQAGTALVWDPATFVKLLDHFARLRQNTFRALEDRQREMEQRFREL